MDATTLNRIILDGWKRLALADQSDADEVKTILTDVLDTLEKIGAE